MACVGSRWGRERVLRLGWAVVLRCRGWRVERSWDRGSQECQDCVLAASPWKGCGCSSRLAGVVSWSVVLEVRVRVDAGLGVGIVGGVVADRVSVHTQGVDTHSDVGALQMDLVAMPMQGTQLRPVEGTREAKHDMQRQGLVERDLGTAQVA